MDEEKAYLLIKTSYGKGATPTFRVWPGHTIDVSRKHRLGEVLDVFASMEGALDAKAVAISKLRRGRNTKIPGYSLRPLSQKRNGDLRMVASISAQVQLLLQSTQLEASLGAVMRANLKSIQDKIVKDYDAKVKHLQVSLGGAPDV